MIYSALIRADHCNDLLRSVVEALRNQSCPPDSVIIVDSSRDDGVSGELMEIADIVVKYPDEDFNFSAAINIGFRAASAPSLLIVSSHVVLADKDLIARACRVADECRVSLFYICHAASGVSGAQLIDRTTFNGVNGLSNSCAMLPRELVMQRPFRLDVFSAEDQEWASWYFKSKHGKILRIEDPKLLYLNPRTNELKLVNEVIAIAYFARKRELMPDRIVGRILRAALAAVRGRRARSRMHWEIAKGLFKANFKKPVRRSAYY